MEVENQTETKKKVVVVEDDTLLRDLLVKKLLRENFDAVGCVDAKAAFRQFDQEKPDVILLDLILPETDGFEILTQIKASQDLSHIPVLILTNHGQKEDVDRALKLGAQDFLVKANFTLSEIIERVQMVFEDQSIV